MKTKIKKIFTVSLLIIFLYVTIYYSPLNAPPKNKMLNDDGSVKAEYISKSKYQIN